MQSQNVKDEMSEDADSEARSRTPMSRPLYPEEEEAGHVALPGDRENARLVDLLLKETRTRRRFALANRMLGWVSMSAIALWFIRQHVLRSENVFPYHLPCISLGWFLAARAKASAGQHSIIASLKRQGNVSAIGPLALTFDLLNIDKPMVADVLAHLLPHVRASDRELLNADERAALNRSLKLDPSKYSKYLVALLKALEQIGDESFLPNVERLAVGGTKARPSEVDRAAKECLPVLREVIRHQKEQSILLRPAAASDDLLRPATASSASDHELLLRPDVS